jgi:flagellar biosynthetic protein FlhB
MSEQADKESKTEVATEKKKRDAIDKGNTPQSREVSSLITMAAMTAILAFSAGDLSSQVAITLKYAFVHASEISVANGAEAWQLITLFGSPVAAQAIKVLAVLAAGGVVASLLQNPPALIWSRIKPQKSRISIKSGCDRIFGKQALVELLKASTKIGFVLSVAFIILHANTGVVANHMLVPISAAPYMLQNLGLQLFAGVALCLVVIAVADQFWARHKWATDLMMTRQEVKDELKQAEGDPLVKARLKSLARDRKRRQMMHEVPEATVILVNPTHYAIALAYIPEKHAAPEVVAKGTDLLALRIRQVAEDHDVPVVEDKPLARALYDLAEVGQMIPPEFYEAVAGLIQYVYALDGRR